MHGPRVSCLDRYKRVLTSAERHEARYQRRKAKREEAKAKRNAGHGFDEVSDFGSLRKSFYKAKKGVNWKASVQRYGCNVLRNAYNYSRDIKRGKDISRGFIEFDICERGKKRHIKSVHITERVAQKALCDYGLVPVMEKSLISANCASQKGKGTDYSANLLVDHLRRYYRKHGNNGYILLGDQHHFFDSINHEVVRRNFEKMLTDKRLIEYAMRFVDAFDYGLGLGSQVCQICAVSYQNSIDHYVKEVLRCKYYQRYMDDWYIIEEDKALLEEYLAIIRQQYKDLGIEMNDKKTVITKISKPFIWLQDRYILTDTGKVIRKPSRGQITRARKKLKKLAAALERGEIDYSAIRCFYASVSGNLKHKNSYKTMQSLNNLHDELFIRRWR